MPGELRLEVVPALAAPSLLLAFEGWNDAGESASSAVRYLAEALAGVPLGHIDPETFHDFTVQRPEVRLDPGGVRRIDWPAYAFRYAVVPGRCELVTGIGAEPHLRWRSFCDEVIELAQRLHVRRVVLLGAFLADVLYSRPVRISGFGSDGALPPELAIQPTGYEGPTGIVGVLHDTCRRQGMPSVSLWAAVPHYVSLAPSPRAALALCERLGSLLGASFDTSELRELSETYAEQVSQAVASDAETAAYVEELEQRVDELTDGDEQLPSGDALAAELTRFLRERDQDRGDDDAARGQ